MTNTADTNQASEALEAKLNTIIFARFYDIPDKQRSTIVKNLSKLIRTEKLKLLAEVRERVIGEKTSPNFDNEYGYCDNCEFQPTDGTKHCLCYYDEKLRKKQRTALNKLEAEL